MSELTNDGTVSTSDGNYALQFTRHLRHPTERVWLALTDPQEMVKWLAEATIDLAEGGAVELRWLNTDDQGNRAIARGTITQLDPPRLIEMDTDIHGRLRWTLEPNSDGCILTFDVHAALPDDYLTLVLAGWHVHIDFLEDALDGQAVDWPNWPLDRWTRHHERYIELHPTR